LLQVKLYIYQNSKEDHRLKSKVILDVDPGIDDAIAIITALKSNNMDIAGITTVSGNVNSKIGALNARYILNILGRSDIPVIQGATRSIAKKNLSMKIKRSLVDIHGKGGLAGISMDTFKKESSVRKTTFYDFIEGVMQKYRNDEISIIATGPLTNIATAIVDNRHFIDSIHEIVIMGGAFGLASKTLGNVTRFAEFNFYCDPEAAKIVLNPELNLDIKIVGLDLTQNPKCAINAKFLKKVVNYDNPTARFVASLLGFAISKSNSFYLHDVFAVMVFQKPSLFKFKRGNVDIILRGTRRGHTKFNENKVSGNVLVAVAVKEQKFKNVLLNLLSK
jgi:inosine-uridine nucleoside N-ribohydrolase